MALGCETFDDRITNANRLNATSEQSLKAIELINEFGRASSPTGLPRLLPGINLLFGLINETEETWKLNYDFLLELL